MSGPGDVGGEVSGDEAAWRDLVARYDTPADSYPAVTPWPDREDLPGPARTAADTATPRDQQGGLAGGGADSEGEYVPADRTRVIRHMGDPRSYSPPEEEDEPYIPDPLPPPAKLDPIAKAAWTFLVGGPAYLLIATFVHWTISGMQAFAAVAAFIGGFVTLVVRGGDKPRRDDDDDGAVV